jgi:hypothetical protein
MTLCGVMPLVSHWSFPQIQLIQPSAAQQIEGAVRTDGRGESIWDRFPREQPEKVQDGSNGDVVCHQLFAHTKQLIDVDLRLVSSLQGGCSVVEDIQSERISVLRFLVKSNPTGWKG